MALLDRLPPWLQWFRGRTGSVVAHWGVAVVGTSLGHLLPWGWGAEGAAIAIALAYGIREWFEWFLWEKTDEAIEDMFGPVVNMLYVLVL